MQKNNNKWNMKIFMRKIGSKTRKCDIIKCIRKNIRTFALKIA